MTDKMAELGGVERPVYRNYPSNIEQLKSRLENITLESQTDDNSKNLYIKNNNKQIKTD